MRAHIRLSLTGFVVKLIDFKLIRKLYHIGRFKKVGEDKEFKLLLSLLDEELDESSLFRLAKNHVEKKYNRRCLNG